MAGAVGGLEEEGSIFDTFLSLRSRERLYIASQSPVRGGKPFCSRLEAARVAARVRSTRHALRCFPLSEKWGASHVFRTEILTPGSNTCTVRVRSKIPNRHMEGIVGFPP